MILCLSAAAACSSKKDEAPSTTTPPPPPPAPKLAATIAGKPVTLAQAFLKALPYDGAYSIYLTSGKGSCKELLDSLYTRSKEDQYVLFTTGPRLAANGTLSNEVTDVLRMGNSVKIAPGSKVTIPSKPAAGSKLDIPIDVDAEVSNEGTLGLHGVIAAEACGEQPFTADILPKATHASTATLTIAGKQVPLVGARRDAKSDRIELSTSPLVCGPATAIANVQLEYAHKLWKARGRWLGSETLQNSSSIDAKEGQAETKDLVVKPGTPGTSDDGPTVPLELSGTGTLDGYTIALAGTIEALDCP